MWNITLLFALSFVEVLVFYFPKFHQYHQYRNVLVNPIHDQWHVQNRLAKSTRLTHVLWERISASQKWFTLTCCSQGEDWASTGLDDETSGQVKNAFAKFIALIYSYLIDFRYLPEFRALRTEHEFFKVCQTPKVRWIFLFMFLEFCITANRNTSEFFMIGSLAISKLTFILPAGNGDYHTTYSQIWRSSWCGNYFQRYFSDSTSDGHGGADGSWKGTHISSYPWKTRRYSHKAINIPWYWEGNVHQLIRLSGTFFWFKSMYIR